MLVINNVILKKYFVNFSNDYSDNYEFVFLLKSNWLKQMLDRQKITKLSSYVFIKYLSTL